MFLAFLTAGYMIQIKTQDLRKIAISIKLSRTLVTAQRPRSRRHQRVCQDIVVILAAQEKMPAE
ncbi:MAG: hypothetical protein AB1733_12485 [Thermodesulfobacteriota bacterium]